MYQAMNDKIQSNVVYLNSSLRNTEKSSLVISIIAVEMYFRSASHRALEYVFWILLWLFRVSRTDKISVGVAQIQIRTWVELGYIPSVSPRISSLLAVMKLENNYAACKAYLDKHAICDRVNIVKLSDIYSGRSRKYHVQAINAALCAIDNISPTKASSRCAKARAADAIR